MSTALRAALSGRGYDVRTTSTGQEAIAGASREPPSLIVLDLGLPDMDGVAVCRQLRLWSDVPIIVVTADGAEDRKVAALDTGADDYVTKPFSMRELEARVRVGLRQRAGRARTDATVIAVGDLVVDVERHRITVGDRVVEVTPTEFSLLAFLARNSGRVLTHATILREVWGPEGEGHVEYLRVYMRALRMKLAQEGVAPRIVTEAGIGYRLIDPAQPLP